MSFKSKISELGKSHTIHSPKREPKYIFLGFFVHGGYSKASEPFIESRHASVNIKTYHSVPKLMTYLSCSPGNSLLGAEGGSDNIILADYFRRSSDFDILDLSEFHHPKAKTTDQLLSHNFLGYVNAALDELDIRPINRNERFKIANPKDLDVCRNSFICDNRVGISHSFPNKSFSTNDRPTHTNVGHNWGIFIYNNNCGIEPGTMIDNIDKIQRDVVENEEGHIIGIKFTLDDIITGLTEEYGLTKDDYLFLFDYSCNNFSSTTINPGDNQRITRRLGRSVQRDLGFGKKKKGKGTRKLKKHHYHNSKKKIKRKFHRKQVTNQKYK
jgi:hypothetical protein